MKELALFQAGLIGEVYSNRNVPVVCFVVIFLVRKKQKK